MSALRLTGSSNCDPRRKSDDGRREAADEGGRITASCGQRRQIIQRKVPAVSVKIG
jgi:hypothetical protein